MEVNDIEGEEGRNFNDGAIQNGDIKANDEENITTKSSRELNAIKYCIFSTN